MMRMVVVFLLFFVGFWLVISSIRNMSGLEALKLTKLAGYSILCAALSLSVLVLITILF